MVVDSDDESEDLRPTFKGRTVVEGECVDVDLDLVDSVEAALTRTRRKMERRKRL